MTVFLESQKFSDLRGHPQTEREEYFETGNVLENEWIVDGDLPPALVVHRVDVGLIDGHALLGEGRGVVDRDLVKFRVGRPILVLPDEKRKGDFYSIERQTIVVTVYFNAKQKKAEH